MLPSRFDLYGEYYGYFALVVLGIALVYVNKNKKYLQIIEYYKDIPDKTKNKLKMYSIIYVLILGVSFFLLGALIRDYNISHAYEGGISSA